MELLINTPTPIGQFISSLLLTTVGFLLTYFITKKPRLRFYYGAIAEIPLQINPTEQQPTSPNYPPHTCVRTHTLVISNQGNASAHDVRIGHQILPAMHSVAPQINIQNKENLNEILIPILCPGESFTITYLYEKTVHFSAINSYLKCNEGLGEVANLQNIRIKSPAIAWIVKIVFFIGILSIVDFILKILPIVNKLLL